MQRIELIHAADCPNVAAARSQLRSALEKEGLPLRWTEWDRADEAAPEHARKYGSPTILVDGVDVAGVDHTEGADCCRVYVDETGFRGIPSMDMLTRALNREAPRAERTSLAGLGALAGGGFASLCCGVPLLLAFLGIAGSGFAGAIAPFQNWFSGLGLAAVLAGWFIFAREWRKASASGAVLRNRSLTAGLLGLASILVLGFAGLTLYSRARIEPPPRAAMGEKLFSAGLAGMTCATCEVHVETTLKKLPGVRRVQASTRTGNVHVIYEPARITPAAILEAMSRTGYRLKKPGG